MARANRQRPRRRRRRHRAPPPLSLSGWIAAWAAHKWLKYKARVSILGSLVALLPLGSLIWVWFVSPALSAYDAAKAQMNAYADLPHKVDGLIGNMTDASARIDSVSADGKLMQQQLNGLTSTMGAIFERLHAIEKAGSADTPAAPKKVAH